MLEHSCASAANGTIQLVPHHVSGPPCVLQLSLAPQIRKYLWQVSAKAFRGLASEDSKTLLKLDATTRHVVLASGCQGSQAVGMARAERVLRACLSRAWQKRCALGAILRTSIAVVLFLEL